jgi:hypothetical protein
MKSYYIFLDQPVGFELDKERNSVIVTSGLDKRKITHGQLDKFRQQIKDLNNYFEKYYETKKG